MLDIILDEIKKTFKARVLPIGLIFIVLFCALIHKLFILQIVDGSQLTDDTSAMDNDVREIKSTRGNIYDCNGVLLASNELSYAVMFEDTTQIKSNDERNCVIQKLIQMIEANGDTLDTEFYIRQNKKGKLEFTVEGAERTRFLKNAYAYALDKNTKDLTDEQKASTAEDVYQFLKNGILLGKKSNISGMFEISDSYSVKDTLKIMAIRYALFCNYPKYLPITVASNVKDATVAAVMEDSADLPGVEIQQQTKRVYNNSTCFAQIMGYTGLINSKEMEEYNKKKHYYNSTDTVGKSGLEKKYEKYLCGKKGSETLATESNGKVISVIKHVNPVPGNDIYLTLDSALQTNVYHALEKEITKILLEWMVPDMNYGSKGKSAAKIKIPIYEVYNALISNNIIDIDRFRDSGATPLEKEVYNKYQNALKEVFHNYDTLLSQNNTVTNDHAGDMEDYLDYFFNALSKNGILLTKDIPKNDATYKQYQDHQIPLNQFLVYAISNNWIDLSAIGIGQKYYSAEEIYTKLIGYTKNNILKNDKAFSKLIYRNLIFNYKLSGNEICLLLFDQDVLKSNKGDIDRLKSNSISPYQFIRDKLSSLEITPAMLALEPFSGSVVITDVNTGQVRALVTYPGYDNNKMANKVNSKYWAKIWNDASKPLLNRPLQEGVAPGSTFKLVSAVAGLQEGVITPYEKIRDKGVFTKVDPGHPPKCSIYTMFHTTHGNVNVSDAIGVSCNYFFYEVGYRLSLDSSLKYNSNLGLKKLKKYASMFGLNTKSGLGLPENAPNISTQDSVRSAIGQGTNLYVPAQMAKYVTTVANSGTTYNLTLLDKIESKENKVILKNKAHVSHDLTKSISQTTWDAVHEGMYKDTKRSDGSANKYFGHFGVTVVGKTGTSQISTSRPNNALFVSYAPYEKPKISMVVVIPGGYSSTNAAEVARDIYKIYFKMDGYKKLIHGNVSDTKGNDVKVAD